MKSVNYASKGTVQTFAYKLALQLDPRDRLDSGGVRHDPQRYMGKTVTVPHFNGDTVEFTSLKRDESYPGIKTLLPFLKNITEESDLENFQDLIVALDACYWLHKTISISLSRFGDDRAI